MKSTMVLMSSSLTPLVVIAGVPILSHDGRNGGLGSSGIVDFDVEIPILSSAFSLIDPSMFSCVEKSKTIIWLSVHPVTSLYPLLVNSSAMTLAFLRTCVAYSLKAGVCASSNATAIAAITFICGHPCVPGNTALSIIVGRFSITDPSGFLSGLETIPLLNINAPLGPLNDLCVVVIIA